MEEQKTELEDVLFNRKLRRKRIINRKFTKKGYAYGIKIGSRKFNLIKHRAKKLSKTIKNQKDESRK